MIYIVEIPHQKPPRCWAVATAEQLINAIAESNPRCGELPEGNSVDEWLYFNGRDLSNQYVFWTDEEAINGLNEMSGHGSAEAHDALKATLIRLGVITDEQED